MCVHICECNRSYKRKTCSACEHVPDHPDCAVGGVQGCIYRIPFPSSVHLSGCEVQEQTFNLRNEDHCVKRPFEDDNALKGTDLAACKALPWYKKIFR